MSSSHRIRINPRLTEYKTHEGPVQQSLCCSHDLRTVAQSRVSRLLPGLAIGLAVAIDTTARTKRVFRMFMMC